MEDYKISKSFLPVRDALTPAQLLKMDYKSPVEVIAEQFQVKMEKDVMNAIRSYRIFVDKDELIKALQYDRDQYIKGFEDGCKDRVDKLVEQVRADAITEFAERLKKYYSSFTGKTSTVLTAYHIDQIAKEMLGGDGNASDQTL